MVTNHKIKMQTDDELFFGLKKKSKVKKSTRSSRRKKANQDNLLQPGIEEFVESKKRVVNETSFESPKGSQLKTARV